MKSVFQLVFYLSLIGIISASYYFKTLYIEQPVDHFSFAINDTFQQRYLINDTYWTPGKGPIFIYTGNEGDIELFANNTGFMWEIAPSFNALVIFAEHRYYGKTLPYGNLSTSSAKYLGYLTSEQALADFAELIADLRVNLKGANNVPVIAFGGSYGGMLAAWIRMKYPQLVQGALASSAPLLQFINRTDCNIFYQIVTRDFTLENPECSKSIRKSWDIMNDLGRTADGLDDLSKIFRLCSPLTTSKDLSTFKAWLSDAYATLAMVDYPYPTDFMANLPGWPIKEVCKQLFNSSMDREQLLNSVFKGISIYFNYTGDEKCLNVSDLGSSSIDFDAWQFQECTEMVAPMCSTGINDMFEPNPWNFETISNSCFKKFKVRPQEMMIPVTYGGEQDITTSSNIIFSNGDLDPWSGGGIMKSLSPTLVSITIAKSAHHLDLRGSNKLDPDEVIAARELEKNYIKIFVESYHYKKV